MSERPTPETDAFILAHAETGTSDWQWCVHARRLENERDQARSERREQSKGLNRLSILNTNLMAELVEARQQRDKARQATAWIPVSQALPDDDATVLVHMADGEVWTGYLDAGSWRFVSGDRIESPVLHWRPFPDPPNP